MRISDLQKLLRDVKRKHGDIELLEQRYSDYGPMGWTPWSRDTEPVWELVFAASQQDGTYYVREHDSLTEEQKKAMDFKPYLLYKGN